MFKCQLFLEMRAFSLEESVLGRLTERHGGSIFFPPGDCTDALCWSCCSLQHAATLSTVHSGLFSSKNALIYTWGLLLNGETFNACKLWKLGGENEIKWFSWASCLFSVALTALIISLISDICRRCILFCLCIMYIHYALLLLMVRNNTRVGCGV